MKTCTTCKEQKPIEQFYRDKSKPGGRSCCCRTCRLVQWARTYAKNQHKIYGRVLAWRAKHPERRRAHKLVEKAIRLGEIIRQPCRVCSNPKTHAHHDDYSKPLDVVWLCSKHHIARHKELDATA